MSFRTVSAILRGRWLLDKHWAESQLPLVLSLLEGKPTSFVYGDGEEQMKFPFVVNPSTMQQHDAYMSDGSGNANIPPGSVGIVSITGPITKYDGGCGEPGAIQMASWLADMEKRQNISSVVMVVDTPGGEARAANILTSTIKKMKKPVLSFVDGMAASLGMWLTAASDEVYVSNKLDEVGSIGSFVMFADYRGFWEQKGIKIHEIYAPQSTDKNKDYRDALEGDYKAIEGDLEVLVNEFISYVKTERKGSASHEKKWNSGKMFYAEDAKKIGLIDGIKTFDQVVSKAAFNAKMKKKKSY
jgi:protease-4